MLHEMSDALPACPVETTLTLISDKWKVLILRDLLTGTKRFGELKKSLDGVSQKVLTSQLRQMEASGLLTRKVPMTTGSGAMLDKNVYDFIDHSTSFLFLPRGVVIGLAMNNEWGFTGYLYAPPLSEAGSALRSYAAGCTRMGAVFIEYGGETYVVAMFA